MHAQYPVGSYIYSDKADNPATYLPYMSDTTWVQTAAGRVLIGAGTADSGTVYTAGAKGGEEKHKLTVEELAAHKHYIAPNCLIWAPKSCWNGTISTTQVDLDGSSTIDGPVFMDRTLDSAGLRYSNNVGNNVAHNNMAPYKVVYIFMWSA